MRELEGHMAAISDLLCTPGVQPVSVTGDTACATPGMSAAGIAAGVTWEDAEDWEDLVPDADHVVVSKVRCGMQYQCVACKVGMQW